MKPAHAAPGPGALASPRSEPHGPSLAELSRSHTDAAGPATSHAGAGWPRRRRADTGAGTKPQRPDRPPRRRPGRHHHLLALRRHLCAAGGARCGHAPPRSPQAQTASDLGRRHRRRGPGRKRTLRGVNRRSILTEGALRRAARAAGRRGQARGLTPSRCCPSWTHWSCCSPTPRSCCC